MALAQLGPRVTKLLNVFWSRVLTGWGVRQPAWFWHKSLGMFLLLLVTQSCLTLHHMGCSTPGFPVLTISWSLLKLMSIESMMLSNHLILYHPLLFLPSVFPGIRVFSNESTLRIRWTKYWSFSFSISPSNEYAKASPFSLFLLKSLILMSAF